MKQLSFVADSLKRHAMSMADGAAINYREKEQEEESGRSFEINVQGIPMTVKIVVMSLEKR
jgi:hypothetical protein